MSHVYLRAMVDKGSSGINEIMVGVGEVAGPMLAAAAAIVAILVCSFLASMARKSFWKYWNGGNFIPWRWKK